MPKLRILKLFFSICVLKKKNACISFILLSCQRLRRINRWYSIMMYNSAISKKYFLTFEWVVRYGLNNLYLSKNKFSLKKLKYLNLQSFFWFLGSGSLIQILYTHYTGNSSKNKIYRYITLCYLANDLCTKTRGRYKKKLNLRNDIWNDIFSGSCANFKSAIKEV